MSSQRGKNIMISHLLDFVSCATIFGINFLIIKKALGHAKANGS